MKGGGGRIMCRNGTLGLLGFSRSSWNEVKKRKTEQKEEEPPEIYALVKIKSRRNSLGSVGFISSAELPVSKYPR